MAGTSQSVLQKPPQKDTARLLVILALALGALSYSNTLTFNFVYDDLPQLVSNPRVHSWSHAPKLFTEQVWSQWVPQGTGNYYRPIFELWLLAQYSLFGLHPWGYHLASVLLHLAVVGMVYLLFRRLTGDRLTAAMGTVLFAAHPTHIETVAWISGSTDLLCAFFVLGSILAYLKASDETAPARWYWQGAALVLYAMAMMSKETAVMMPALLMVFEWWFAKTASASAKAVRVLPFIVATGVYLLVRHWVLLGFMHSEGHSVGAVAVTLPQVLWFYVRHLFWPLGLSVFYDSAFVGKPGFWDFYAPFAAVVIFIAGVVWISRKSHPAAFGATWLLAMLVPALVGIAVFIPEELVHDRYLYLPSMGFALLIAVALRKLKSEGELLGGPRLQIIVVLALGGVMAAETAAQNIFWTNDLILYAHGLNVAPKNVIAINHLANEMYKRGQPSRALALYREAQGMRPELWQTHFALGITLYELGHYEEATRELEGAAEVAPGNAEQYFFLGLCQLSLSNNARAEQEFKRALQRNPMRPGANNALATALLRQGKTEEAKAALRAEVNLTHNEEASRDLERLEKQ